MTKPWELCRFQMQEDVYKYGEKLGLDKTKIKILAWQEERKNKV